MNSVAGIAAALSAASPQAGLSRQNDSSTGVPRTAAATASGTGVYNDFSDIAKLKGQSHADPQAAMKEVAHQFESLFVTMMMKAMRDTLPKDGMLASNEMESYQSMFDQQLSLDL